MTSATHDPSFEELLEYLKNNRGFDFTGYKRSSLMRRVNRRMQAVGLNSAYTDYLDYLEVHPDEFKFLFDTILINLTAFFRDPGAWDYLAKEVVPLVIQRSEYNNGIIRVWSAGCASGEEAYSAAITFAEALGTDEFTRRVRIYATDVDDDALQKARHGSYTPKELEGVPPELRDKYFTSSDSKQVFRSDLRRAIIVGRHDLIQDAPISRLDLLCCRNTLMYFNAETQSQVLKRMHFALRDAGYLFLGRAEMLITQARLFTPASLDHRIFARVSQPNTHDRLFTLSRVSSAGKEQRALMETAFEGARVAQVLVNPQGELLQANQESRAFFNLTPEVLGQSLAESGLAAHPINLQPLVQQAFSERRTFTVENVQHQASTGNTIYMDSYITPLLDRNGDILAVSISFVDMTLYYQAREQLENSRGELVKAYEELQTVNEELETTNEELNSTNEELETANEELQSTIEELETTNEELQSTNEELETTNEELQSANEEMETMNEELQATNEELQTVNDQLSERTSELARINGYLDSILSSVPMGIIVLDQRLSVLSWNRKTEDLWGLQSAEVEGKSIITLDIGLPVRQLIESVQACLRGEVPVQKAIVEAVNRRGRTIRCQVACSPLITPQSGEGRGVILLMEGQEEPDEI